MAVSGIQVKICGIRKEGDARFVQQCGADFVGMIHFPKSPRHVEIEQIRTMLPAIQPGKRVAVTVAPDLLLVETLLEAGVDYFQIHLGSSTLDQVKTWSSLVTPSRLWLAPKLPPGSPFPEELLPYADTMLIDTYSADKHGGTGAIGDWRGFRRLKNTYPATRFILSGGLKPTNICEAIASSGADFVDLSSGVESGPGIKDRKKIKTLFAQLSGNS